MPWEELGGFISEFQMTVDEDGLLTGAIGLLIEGNQALLHSEAIRAGADPDLARSALWRRVQTVARHQGVHRVWTQEDADYWRTSGFSPVPPPLVDRVQASFLKSADSWTACDLMDPERAKAAVNEQLAILEAERMREADEFQGKVRIFRAFALLLAFIVLAGCLWLMYRVASTPGLMKRFMGG